MMIVSKESPVTVRVLEAHDCCCFQRQGALEEELGEEEEEEENREKQVRNEVMSSDLEN